MDTISINSENSNTSDPYKLFLYPINKMNLKGRDMIHCQI